ncbi:MAG: 4-carboxymuconolactone decarboxylase [Chloroflexota bacterium]|jgi:4-carboxymuconolactone decarboxylase|nr:4-carboxymuconolactone decarboxylase [Chloroflexota bacterium]
MSRLPAVEREALSSDGQAVWDRIAAVRGAVRGPFGVLIKVPPLADRVAALEDYFRFDGSLSEAERELVTLAAVREIGARYAWSRHEHRAREAHVAPEVIEALRTKGTLEALAPRDRIFVEVARSLSHTHRIPDELFKQAQDELGTETLVEAVTLTGHYHMIGLLLNGFDVPPPDDTPTF